MISWWFIVAPFGVEEIEKPYGWLAKGLVSDAILV
jgi:hypothetical protein